MFIAQRGRRIAVGNIKDSLSELRKRNAYLDTSVYISGNHLLEIDHCRKIVEYNDVYVKVKTPTVTVSVWGSGLTISDYNTDGIVVNGKISSVEFEEV